MCLVLCRIVLCAHTRCSGTSFCQTHRHRAHPRLSTHHSATTQKAKTGEFCIFLRLRPLQLHRMHLKCIWLEPPHDVVGTDFSAKFALLEPSIRGRIREAMRCENVYTLFPHSLSVVVFFFWGGATVCIARCLRVNVHISLMAAETPPRHSPNEIWSLQQFKFETFLHEMHL